MRTLFLSITLFFGIPITAAAAPALGDKPPKWEYAELTYRTTPARRPGGVDADGKDVPAAPASISIRWISPAGEVDVKGWDELVNKLKAPTLKKGSDAYQKMQILNHLGSEGWELMEQQTSGPTGSGAFGARDRGPGLGERGPSFSPASGTGTWLLKRRVP